MSTTDTALSITPATPRTPVDLTTLNDLVSQNLLLRITAETVFTAYDVTSALRLAHPELEIDHESVKGLVRAFMRCGPIAQRVYEERRGAPGQVRALHYSPVVQGVVAPAPDPSAPVVPDPTGAPAPFAPLV